MYFSKKVLALFLFLLFCFGFGIYYSDIYFNGSIKDIGSFEYEGTKTQVIRSGDCHIYMTKWKDEKDVKFFFSCPRSQ